jgi:carboxyl-terminal processing protease
MNFSGRREKSRQFQLIWRFLALVTLISELPLPGCGSSAPGTIGAALGQRPDHRLFVRSLPPNQGADRAGLAVDDEILEIDGKNVRTMSQDDVRRAVRGDVGSTLIVTILRGGEKRDVKVVRTPLLAEGK